MISLKVAFLEIPPISRFRFGSMVQKENAESAEIFCFSLISKDFYQT